MGNPYRYINPYYGIDEFIPYHMENLSRMLFTSRRWIKTQAGNLQKSKLHTWFFSCFWLMPGGFSFSQQRRFGCACLFKSWSLLHLTCGGYVLLSFCSMDHYGSILLYREDTPKMNKIHRTTGRMFLKPCNLWDRRWVQETSWKIKLKKTRATAWTSTVCGRFGREFLCQNDLILACSFIIDDSLHFFANMAMEGSCMNSGLICRGPP